MDWSQYKDFMRHQHPRARCPVEVVAYERSDGKWDVFVCEPTGSCPELEAKRVDDRHIFIARIESIDELDPVTEKLAEQLGDDYQWQVYYREAGSRRFIGQIQSHLQKRGVRKIWVRCMSTGDWELVIWRKDFPIAAEVAESNVQP